MANTKLDRIERDIEKTRAKVLEYQKKLKDLEAQKVEEENAMPYLKTVKGLGRNYSWKERFGEEKPC